MERIEWTRLEGNDVEALVAMLVNLDRRDSVRITPSIGDGGVDILDRAVEPTGLDDVYQVKRHTEALTTKQKNDVEKGLKRLVGPPTEGDTVTRDPRWAGLQLGTWHLVTPWDPTPEQEKWLHDLGTAYGITARWKGLTYIEARAASNWDVVDYYLHGGRDRVKSVYQEMAALFAPADTSTSPDVEGVTRRVQTALRALDRDPHYRYEVRFGQGGEPSMVDRPRLVMSYVVGDRSSEEWTVVDVIARCAASVQERPIVVEGSLHLDPGSEAERSYREHLRFGSPFESPDGSYTGTIDAPGGLGGQLTGARVVLTSVTDVGEASEFHLEVLDPDGTVKGAVDLVRTERSQGDGGVRVMLQEVNQVFTIEDRFDLTDETGTRNLSMKDITGMPVAAALPAYQFLSNCRPPNVGRLSVRHTPPARGIPDVNLAQLGSTDLVGGLSPTLRVLEMFESFQENTAQRLVVPDFSVVGQAELERWRFAHALLRGSVATQTLPGDHALTIEVPRGTELQGGDLSFKLPLTVIMGEVTVELGHMIVELEGATVAHSVEGEDTTTVQLTTPDRRVTYRVAADQDPA